MISTASPLKLNLLLVAIGSHGDVHPFLALGRELRARGHDVTILTNQYFASRVERLGLGLIQIGTSDEYASVLQNPELWHPRHGLKVIGVYLVRILADVFDAIASRYEPGRTVVAAASNAFAARIAQEKLGVPLATVNLQPSLFFSRYDAPVLHPAMGSINVLPSPLKRILLSTVDGVVNRALGPPINGFRAKVGLPPVKRLSQWWFSPQQVVGLFPEWFARPQPDWPAGTRLATFPLYDESDIAAVPHVAARFVEAGQPPLVFAPGSAMVLGDRYFATVVETCRGLGRRGIILGSHGSVPPLPESVRQFDYVPMSWLLPRSAALVHHGGIGTLALGMRAGLPQLITPMAFDQPDNAARAARLGVGRVLSPRSFRPGRLVRAIEHLLTSAEVARCCRDYAERLAGRPNLEVACDAIESLAG